VPIFSRFWVNPTSKLSDPDRLARDGPALQVEIGVPSRLAAHFVQVSKPIPQPQEGLALIDTGASVTGVDREILTRLGVAPVGTVNIVTPSGHQTQYLYPCRISFPGTPIQPLDFNAVTGSNAIPGFAMLIGRDVLRYFQLVYNGVDGFWTLAF
jgi:predicted aspartyl protease